jgi:hypothetical protein
MALPSRYESTTNEQRPIVLGNPTSSSGSSQSQTSSAGYQGIEDPEALAALETLIRQLQAGTTEGQKQQAERNAEITRVRGLSRDYSKGAAFLDAENAVNQALRKAQEANMPAIVKSIQGAGTSSSSMQGLLAQRLATESAQAAGALGAKQAVDYGNISANLAGVLEGLTRVNDIGTDNLIKALDLTRIQRNSSASYTNQSQQSGGGGQRLVLPGNFSSMGADSYYTGADSGNSAVYGTSTFDTSNIEPTYTSYTSGNYYGSGLGGYDTGMYTQDYGNYGSEYAGMSAADFWSPQ